MPYCNIESHKNDPDWNYRVDGCPYCRIDDLRVALTSQKELLEIYQQEAIERDNVIAEIDTKRIILVDAMKQFANNSVGVGWISKFAKEILMKVGEEI